MCFRPGVFWYLQVMGLTLLITKGVYSPAANTLKEVGQIRPVPLRPPVTWTSTRPNIAETVLTTISGTY